MAKQKRRKLYGAALAAHQKKAGKSSRKRRKPSKRRASARRRPVASKRKAHRYIPQTKRNKDGSRPRVKRSRAHVSDYMRNPKRRKARRNPGMFGMNQLGSTAMQGLMGAGVILGTILAVGYANRQLERWSATQLGWGNIAGKLAIAVAGGVAATWLVRKGKLSKEMGYAVTGAAFAPLALGVVARFTPALASQVTLAQDEDGMSAQLEAPMGPSSEAAIQAELEAQLEDEESEASMF